MDCGGCTHLVSGPVGRPCVLSTCLLVEGASEKRIACDKKSCVGARMKHGAVITDLSPEVFKLVVDRLLPISEDGGRTDALDFACLRLISRGVRQLCDAAVRRLDLHRCSGDEMQALLHRFTGAVIPNLLSSLNL